MVRLVKCPFSDHGSDSDRGCVTKQAIGVQPHSRSHCGHIQAVPRVAGSKRRRTTGPPKPEACSERGCVSG